jgi:hypothetical protein
MSREKRNVGPPNRYDPAEIAAMPQWASPLSPSSTPPRHPLVYLTGNWEPVVLGVVGLPTTAVAPPIPAVAPPIPQATVFLIDAAGGSAVAAGGSAVDPADPNSGDLEMELDSADPNSPDSDWDVGDDIFRRQRPHRLIMAHLYNTDE